MKRGPGLLVAFLAVSVLLAGRAVQAADLRVGVASEVTTLDPHFFHLTPNTEIDKLIYSAIVTMDPKENIIPDLATNWSATDATHWTFKLRPGVTFHDGTLLTADDVVFSYERARNVPNSPASFQQFLKHVAHVTAPDPLTVVVETTAPDPILPNELMNVWIVSRKNGANATTQDYNSGRAAIGTGPYNFVRWIPGDRIELVRNDSYFGVKPAWEHVIYRPLTNDASRVAALLSGDVDIINAVPSNDIANLERRPGFSVTSIPSDRIIYFALDVGRSVSPQITDAEGHPMQANPLQDVRVRRALSMAIDRQALVARVLQQQGVPAGQFTPDWLAGGSPALKPPAYDLAGARALLSQAGYPHGFGLTLSGPNDRYPNDAQVVQTVAQMWSRLGLQMKVDTNPKSVYFPRVTKLEYSALLAGNSSDTAEPMSQLQYCLGTFDAAKGIGAGNPGRYSNPAFDRILDEATVTLDTPARDKLLAQAAELAIGQDVAAIPVYFVRAAWAMRSGLRYDGYPQEGTVASLVHPAL
jgi:peptide/nickel transport system substrate-binding protein